MWQIVWQATGQTLYMVTLSTLLAVVLGMIPAVVMTLTAPDGLRPNRLVYGILDVLVNVFRSFPFVILMIIVIPMTRAITGTSIGTTAAIVPLTVSAIPFASRIFENALRETDPGVIEAARSFGAGSRSIIWRVYIKESVPRLLNGIILLFINMIGASAMAGVLGGGGLGDVAIRYGYQMYQLDYLLVTSLVLIVLVQLLQGLGNLFYKKLV
ncbi:MAG: ABC transporter permease [Solobacterium sp.]|jgi:D-methionine transport system permease protein|nr:ABC transporter permease [Solobacterium sp.]MCH4049424.1 ABC transporter permease [Solobacterium sp.]MCH4075280.1 ABC transporter permease [Solobacterium sp.]MCI1314362.1 ABC transporter permease [Solobacterium sp.]MCI1346529.1 ABC transporter permease [Solobacterium sp.]